ncbi:MAG: 2-C-methyl-D-erythritol 4-phosphate cytidylyltransferase [Muribaculaceae bacterium]|nr:2-C-methyl-D-erythritol 4-phosphate cytidylyltransferase [Muribaculaceae bacterium]MDE5844464.1 2-C-methyl-D-erythritol 4-phosphate cytidylyltransferase [Muribaculaceae bacterium]MDE5858055.1 2-C-methyl-D-erythritol 4-phosphate cytidylyltransferase [Muribaculaceae bacterium]MDE7369236.1 2-C-methyl-D-erythritol 4-phosphate cytidylyltransferase [Muribaculaceae bacterium]
MSTVKIHTIIVAGGSGSRFGADIPKQYCLLAKRPILIHTIEAMRHALPDAEITLVISSDMQQLWDDLCKTHDFISPTVVYGGATRAQSVANAINSINNPDKDDIVLIHDGARPLVDEPTVKRVVECLISQTSDGVIPAIALTDSIRELDDTGSHPVDRSRYRAVQTPQGFNLIALQKAYQIPERPDWTDDASVMATAGKTKINLVEGSPENIKITNPLDIEIAEAIMRCRQK